MSVPPYVEYYRSSDYERCYADVSLAAFGRKEIEIAEVRASKRVALRILSSVQGRPR